VSALFASTVVVMGLRQFRGVRWFLVIAFLIATAVFGLFFQLMSWLLPRFITVLANGF
jgi:hypothetical protein